MSRALSEDRLAGAVRHGDGDPLSEELIPSASPHRRTATVLRHIRAAVPLCTTNTDAAQARRRASESRLAHGAPIRSGSRGGNAAHDLVGHHRRLQAGVSEVLAAERGHQVTHLPGPPAGLAARGAPGSYADQRIFFRRRYVLENTIIIIFVKTSNLITHTALIWSKDQMIRGDVRSVNRVQATLKISPRFLLAAIRDLPKSQNTS